MDFLTRQSIKVIKYKKNWGYAMFHIYINELVYKVVQYSRENK